MVDIEPVPISKISRKSLERESLLVESRNLGEYVFNLRFEPEVLTGQKVLNFGSGGSHIGKELKRKRVNADIVELDLKFDPGNIWTMWLVAPIRLLESHIDSGSDLHEKLVNIRKQLALIKGRDFVQGDGRALPFPDRTFDTVLAHYSTYQIPNKAKRAVYRELLRVGDILHCGPIFKPDYEVLQELAEEMGFEIVVCHPFPTAFGKEDFVIRNPGDYSQYTKEENAKQRIQPPKTAGPKITRVLGKAISASIKGSSFIVLRRKTP